MLYNLKSTISNTSFKNNSGNICFSQQSSTQQTPAQILEEIDYLENENKKLKNINIEENGQLFLKTCFGMLMPSSV